jgi:hypothetical protein
MNKKDKESFILHLKQKKKDNIKTEMFNSVNEYIVNTTGIFSMERGCE